MGRRRERLDNRLEKQKATRKKNGRRKAKERAMLEWALEENNQNRTATARALGISRVGLYKKMKKHGMIGWASEPTDA